MCGALGGRHRRGAVGAHPHSHRKPPLDLVKHHVALVPANRGGVGLDLGLWVLDFDLFVWIWGSGVVVSLNNFRLEKMFSCLCDAVELLKVGTYL